MKHLLLANLLQSRYHIPLHRSVPITSDIRSFMSTSLSHLILSIPLHCICIFKDSMQDSELLFSVCVTQQMGQIYFPPHGHAGPGTYNLYCGSTLWISASTSVTSDDETPVLISRRVSDLEQMSFR